MLNGRGADGRLQFGPRSLTALFGKGILLFGRQADDSPARLFQLLLIGGLIGFRDFPAAGLERGALFKQDLLIFGRQGLEQLLIDEQGPVSKWVFAAM